MKVKRKIVLVVATNRLPVSYGPVRNWKVRKSQRGTRVVGRDQDSMLGVRWYGFLAWHMVTLESPRNTVALSVYGSYAEDGSNRDSTPGS